MNHADKNVTIKEFVYGLPKAELHVHIEGTMEPEQMLLFAERNKIVIPYRSLDEARAAYNHHNFSSFINAYNRLSGVLRTEQDFYELTTSYLSKAFSQGVLHVEIFFDVLSYEHRGIVPAIIIHGMHEALVDAKKAYGITGSLIVCFLRDLSQEDAFATLQTILPFKDKIIAIGLASTEINNPPSKFQSVFASARAHGYHLVAHAGEQGPADYIMQAINLLHAERIDHGIRCVENKEIITALVEKKIPLTVCPLSNVKLGSIQSLQKHPLKQMLNEGLIVSIHSDDPAFFGGYIADNYYAIAQALHLSFDDIVCCARNSFMSSFIDYSQKIHYINLLEKYIQEQSYARTILCNDKSRQVC